MEDVGSDLPNIRAPPLPLLAPDARVKIEPGDDP
jgi:hypothetical protein